MMKRILLIAVIGLVAVFAFAGIYDAMKSDPAVPASQVARGAQPDEPAAVRVVPPPAGGPAVEIHTDEADEPPKIEVGERSVLADDRRVTIMNLEPISDGVWSFPPGSSCLAASDGRLTVVAATDEKVLLRYARPPQAEVVDPKVRAELAIRQHEADQGLPGCPDGTVFFTGRDDYSEIPGEDDTDTDLKAAKRLLTPAAPVSRPRSKGAGKR